jgi:predicted ATP-grasp superfamily ATP-dependent carboligase
LIDHDLPPADLVDLCLRKDLFAARALELGFPTPRTWAPVCASLAYKMADDLEYPVFVKPVHMHRTGSLPVESGHQWSKGWRVASAPALRQLYDVLAAHHADATIIQDYIAGPDSEHASVHVYIDAAGNIVGAFSAQKMRVWPSGAGVGCFVTSRRNDTLIALAARILTTLRYTGFAIVQFKRDVRQNTWKLLEINCRYGTWTELPSRCGCNFPATAYAAITGHPVCRTHQRDGMSWMDFNRDVQAFAADRRRGKGTWWSYLRSISSTGCWAFLALDDPLPFVWRLAHRNAA